jgi:2-dehydro-3-deoxyphosphogluconate aldolase/(4S)-4-hydroxy-2-oxoglutarate aldolase
MIITKKSDIRKRIEEIAIVPSIRPANPASARDDARFAVEALNSAGIPIAEIHMTVPGAIDVITDVARQFPETIVGADLLDLETARRCLDAGARFLTSPGLIPGLVDFAVANDVLVFPGALTPSEVIAAWKAGADFVKVFPCSLLGGATYIKSLRAPLPQVGLIASGGVNQQTAGSFILAGAAALGIGTELIPQNAVRACRREQIHELARRFLLSVKEARSPGAAQS